LSGPTSSVDEEELDDRGESELLDDERLDDDDGKLCDVLRLPKSWLDDTETDEMEGSELLDDELLEVEDIELCDVPDDDGAPEFEEGTERLYGAGRDFAVGTDEIDEAPGNVTRDDAEDEDFEDWG
jgi:hypothetical protein